MSTLAANMKDLLQRTATALAAESAVPRSPGYMEGPRPRLCAGAEVVYQAAIMVEPKPNLTGLAKDMIAAGKGEIVRKAAEFDVDPAFVAAVIARNDLCRDGERRGSMVEFLSDLAR